MKKFIALGGIAAMSTLGFIGLGSAVASAAPPVPSAENTVCQQANTLVTNIGSTLQFDALTVTNAGVNAGAAFGSQTNAVNTYVSTALQVLDDVDNTPQVSSQQLTADKAAFSTATNSAVSAFQANSAANVALFNAQSTQANDTFRQSVYLGLQSAACGS